jgi:hypothetical protein
MIKTFSHCHKFLFGYPFWSYSLTPSTDFFASLLETSSDTFNLEQSLPEKFPTG